MSAISLVIPAYNERAYLPRLLDTVDAARAQYRGGADAVQVIVADNHSTDGTAAIAVERGCDVATVEQRVIGAVRNAGARLARGRILCFVDADARIHPESFNVVEAHLENPRIIGGATGVRLERWSLGLAATYVALMPLVVLARMDTGLVFCRRPEFDTVGGYNERLRFAEDVQFLWDLKRLGWKRGQRLVRARGAKAIASTRKFDEHGEWHYFPMFWRGIKAIVARSDALDRQADRYWYGRQREP